MTRVLSEASHSGSLNLHGQRRYQQERAFLPWARDSTKCMLRLVYCLSLDPWKTDSPHSPHTCGCDWEKTKSSVEGSSYLFNNDKEGWEWFWIIKWSHRGRWGWWKQKQWVSVLVVWSLDLSCLVSHSVSSYPVMSHPFLTSPLSQWAAAVQKAMSLHPATPPIIHGLSSRACISLSPDCHQQSDSTWPALPHI